MTIFQINKFFALLDYLSLTNASSEEKHWYNMPIYILLQIRRF